jgi:hypothetical protein
VNNFLKNWQMFDNMLSYIAWKRGNYEYS